eukprot:TRINITY_DN4278_c0_g1_i1.p1 TRINITY_DN4278_c0_g1~~TRINITY_DN4278_c0_g1_i1.p1  ORF type:complete len:259 (-),score=29.91 TRINITY_DN4278_c0_g1_i1:453-1229(-)
MPIGQIAPRRLADTIVEQLETMILEGALQPGERLPPERVLAERFGVSRPSLREAVQRLAAKGLLKSRQGGGNYVTESLGSSFSDPLIHLLENRPDAQRDLLEFRRTLESDCAYYAALRATEVDRDHLRSAYDHLQACYAEGAEPNREAEGLADSRFHLAIAEASHNVILLHTTRNLFNMFKSNLLLNIDGLYASETETRDNLKQQHQALFEAIVEGHADEARALAGSHIQYVQQQLSERTENNRRLARARRRGQMHPD